MAPPLEDLKRTADELSKAEERVADLRRDRDWKIVMLARGREGRRGVPGEGEITRVEIARAAGLSPSALRLILGRSRHDEDANGSDPK